jgi:chromosome segregation protein
LREEENRKRLSEIEGDLERLTRRQEELEARAAGESKSKEEQLSLFDGTDDLFKKKSEDLAHLQTRLTEAETQLSRDKQTLLVKEGAITRLRSNCTTLEVDLKSYQVRHANLADESKRLADEAEVLAHDLEEIERTHTARLQQRSEEDARVIERREQVGKLTEEFRELQGQVTERDRRLAAVNAQINVLEGLQAKLEGFSEGAKAILNGKLDGVIAADGCELLLKNISVATEYAPRLEALLGAVGEGVVVLDRRRLAPVAEALRERKLGRAYLKFETPGGKVAAKSSALELPPGATPVLDVVSVTNPALGSLVQNLLADCYFLEDLGGFLDWWEAHPDFVFRSAITLEGELVDQRGWILSGSKPKGADRSFLGRANQIKKFTSEKNELESQLETLRGRATILNEKIEKAEKAVEDQRRRVMEIAQEVATLETQARNARRNVENNAKQREQKDAELKRQEGQKVESTERLERARQQLAESEGEISAQKQKIDDGENAVAKMREEREVMRESFNDARLQIAEKRQRLELLERGLRELESQTREVQTQRNRRISERTQLREQNGDLAAGKKQQAAVVEEQTKRMAELMAKLDKEREALKSVEGEIEVVEKGLSSQRATHDKVSRELNSMDVKIARLQAQAQHLQDEIRREYDVDLNAVNWRSELWEAGDSLPDRLHVQIDEDSFDEPEPEERGEPSEEDLAALEETDWEAIESEIETLRMRLQSIGAVNLVAIEEYKELNERYTFLKAQSDDLWASKDELLKAIDEINTTSKELFSNTFDQIRKNFVFTFDALFGGGRADLQLVDNEDVLESGIDIIAQPPGTRLKTLALLSGGQKTMTAVALLFAVYMVKPSPFCVLDELDAPLDDANIGRFCKMLERFLEYSQFLIITHNKRTISVADTIYGVTMQEKGVSRLLSMRFDKETGKTEEVSSA